MYSNPEWKTISNTNRKTFKATNRKSHRKSKANPIANPKETYIASPNGNPKQHQSENNKNPFECQNRKVTTNPIANHTNICYSKP